MTQDAFTLHKPIRNRIRQYDRDALLNIAMLVLLKNETEIYSSKGYIPWECMLLIRWILQYASSGNHLKTPSVPIVNGLLNDIKNLYNKSLSLNLSEPHGLNKFMRRMAFQQFSYQMPLPEMGWKAGRQVILFTEIGEQYNVEQKFEMAAGVSIKDFLAISFSIFSILQQDNTFALKARALYSVFEPEIVQKYFDLVAVTPEQAKAYLDADNQKKGQRFVLQFYELSPLVRKPFLISGDNYVVFSKRLFRQFFANFIYDFLYDLPDSFGEFGGILEKYVRQQLEELECNIILDKSWKKILSKNFVSAPDFTIPQEDGTIFIEAKRKHLTDIPKIMQSNDALSRHLDDSIVKGVIQIYSLAHELLNERPDSIKNFDNFYGVVVSFKDHYLRGGQQFWDEFLRDEIEEKLIAHDIDPNLIPAENIFLLSVDEFDYLSAFLAQNPKITLGSIFSKVKEFEADPQRRSFFFHDHLQRIAGGDFHRPEHLWQKIADVIDGVTERMKKYEAERDLQSQTN